MSKVNLLDPSELIELPPIPEWYPENHVINYYKELDHAADAVRWLRILLINPSLELILAVAEHDQERIVYPGSTAGFAGERNTPEYYAHKKNHAARSAALAYHKLKAMGHTDFTCQRVAFLILHHDDTGEEIRELGDIDLQYLVSADSCAFFSGIALEMLSRNESEERIRGKMKFSIEKMDDSARVILRNWKSPNSDINEWKDLELNNFFALSPF